MKRYILLTFSVLLVVLLGYRFVSATQSQFPGLEQHSPIFKTVSPQEAKSLIETRKELLLIDVRGQDELHEGYIEGSMLMPLWNIIKGTQRPPKDKPILLICAVGGRSLALGQLMSRNGWNEVYNLKGGISAWKKANQPLKY